MTPRPRIGRNQTERLILATEQDLARLFWHLDPNEVATEVARRLRSLRRNEVEARTPSHCMFRAIELAAAYFNGTSCLTISPEHFEMIVGHMLYAEEPLMQLLLDEHGLMSFMAYAHQSQLRHQRGLWTVPMGRAEMLFGDPTAFPRLSPVFAQRFGLTPRQWVQMAFVAYAATGLQPDRLGFGERYINQFAGTAMPVEAARAFLSEVSLSFADIGEKYRVVRYGSDSQAASDPWTWYQRPAILTEWPILRFRSSWGVPAPSLLIPLFDELLFKRLVDVAVGNLRRELSDRFVDYIVRVFRHQMPGCRIVDETGLRGSGGGKVADLAVELPNAVLVIEAKSIVFARDTLTTAALTSGAAREVIDGAIQVAKTAKRIAEGGCPTSGLPRDKPIVGIIATLGTLPQANAEQFWEGGSADFAKQQLSGPRLTPALYCHPFALGTDALEFLSIHLRAKPAGLLDLIEEKRLASLCSGIDWPLFLSNKVEGGKGHDLTLWRSAYERLFAEFNLDEEPIGDST